MWNISQVSAKFQLLNAKCEFKVISYRMKHHLHQHQLHQLRSHQVVRGQLCGLILLSQMKMTRIRWLVTSAQKEWKLQSPLQVTFLDICLHITQSNINRLLHLEPSGKCVTFRLIRKLSKRHLNVTTSTQKVHLAIKK